jgi:hypothetical protein
MRWQKIFHIACTCLLALLMGGCVTLPEASYKMYLGPMRPASELSILHLGDAHAARIDERVVHRSDWSDVQLMPGKYTIDWGHEFMVSTMIAPSGFMSRSYEATVVLEPGHVYTLKADRTTADILGSIRFYFWIYDETTRHIIAGTPKP